MNGSNPATQSPANATGSCGVSKDDKPIPPARLKQLNVSTRIALIRRHRQFQRLTGGFGPMYHTTLDLTQHPTSKSGNIEFGDKIPKSFKPIYVKQMDSECTEYYYNKFLLVTLIEDPIMGMTNPINVVGEDEKGSTIQISIHEIPHTAENGKLLGFGTQIAIVNPYHRIAMDGNPGIRVEDPVEVIILGKKKDLCRYCTKANAQRHCSNCKVTYCSRECQLGDWKIYKHKMICKD